MKTNRFKSVVCVDVILKKENKVLFMKKKKDNEYELPGGHLEKDEDLLDAMIREAKEELEIDLKKEDLKLVHIMHHYNKERINFIYEANARQLNPKIGEPEKCSELIWVEISNPPKEISKKLKRILENVENNIFYDTY